VEAEAEDGNTRWGSVLREAAGRALCSHLISGCVGRQIDHGEVGSQDHTGVRRRQIHRFDRYVTKQQIEEGAYVRERI
jgi:hypothetical protein